MVEPDQGVIVPGHGDHAGRAFADAQAAGFAGIVERARRIHAGELDMEAALDDYPFPTHEHDQPLRPLERALAQLDGRLDAGTT